MGYQRVSITVPDEIFKEAKEAAAQRRVKLSRFISEALADKVRKSKEEAFIQRINEIFEDQDVAEEHRFMAGDIADSTNVEELPW
jgi:metal-responsive CopG/Arc/MetJ family transcriptional regulator